MDRPLTDICIRYSSSDVSVIGFDIAIPALATNTSSLPKSFTTSANACSTRFGSVTSTWYLLTFAQFSRLPEPRNNTHAFALMPCCLANFSPLAMAASLLLYHIATEPPASAIASTTA